MSAYDLLTKSECDFIEWYIETYGSSADYSNRNYNNRAKLKDVLHPWNEAKSNGILGEIFKDSLIKTMPVNYKVPKPEIVNRLIDSTDVSAFIRDFHDWTKHLDKTNFKKEFSIWDLDSLISYDNLAENSYYGDTFYLKDPSKEGEHWIAINSGCKPVKVLGKLNSIFHFSEKYEKFRIAHSMALNTAKLHGNLCISIHPMDYMTMSDNNSGWDSCMSWTNCGSYRQGTVEMMNSPCVVVAYLTASTPCSFYGKEWNNKKWRSLYIVHEDMITSIKGYPYQVQDIDKIVIDTLAEMVTSAFPHINYGKGIKYNYDSQIEFDEKLIDIEFRTGHMYNDFGTIEHLCRINTNINHDIKIDYSGKSECMWCGSTRSYFEDDDRLFCDDCEEFSTCDCCGRRCGTYDLIEAADGCWICDDCREEYYDFDMNGDLWRTDEMERIYVLPRKLEPYVNSNKINWNRYDTYDTFGFWYYPSYCGCSPWLGDTSSFKKEISNFESKFLKKEVHVHVAETCKSWDPSWIVAKPYVYLDELQDWAREEFRHNWSLSTNDENTILDVFLENTTYWKDPLDCAQAKEEIGF